MPGSAPKRYIYLDVNRPGCARCVLRTRESTDLSDQRLALAVGDKYDLVIMWRTFVDDAEGGIWQWSTGVTIDAVLTVESSLSDTTPLEVSDANGFAEGSPDPNGDFPYSAVFDLSGEAAGAAVGENKSIMAVLDVRVVVNETRFTYRVLCEVFRSANGGPITPSGTTDMVNHAAAQLRQTSTGSFQLYDFGREAWVTFVLRNGVLEFVEDV